MKRAMVTILLIAILFSLSACSQGTDRNTNPVTGAANSGDKSDDNRASDPADGKPVVLLGEDVRPEQEGDKEPESMIEVQELSIYSPSDEETWFVIEGQRAENFIKQAGQGREVQLSIYFMKMLDENNGETVTYISINAMNDVSYSGMLGNSLVDGYGISLDGKNFRINVNKDRNIIAIYLNARAFAEDKIANESIVEDYKQKLSKIENNASLFDGADKCLLDNGSGAGGELWDIAAVSKAEKYSFPVQNQVLMTELYDDGYVSYAEDTEYFRPLTDDYLVCGWGDNFSRTYLVSFDEDGKVAGVRMRIYNPGLAEYDSVEETATTAYRDENAIYGVFDVTALDNTSLYYIVGGRLDALYYSLTENQSSFDWMYLSKPEPTEEDLTVKKIVLISNPDSHLLDAERLSEDYIVKKDTYSPNDGVVQYIDVPRTIIDYYDVETHIIIGSIKFYTFQSEAEATKFYTNIENSNASLIGNRVYIKYMYSGNDLTTWEADTENLLHGLGELNTPEEVLWSRNRLTIEEFKSGRVGLD